MADFQIKAITSWDEVGKIRPAWESMQLHPGVDFEFFHLVLKGRSSIISPCVFVVSDNEQIVSLLVGRIEHSIISLRLGYAHIGKIKARKLVLMDGGFMGSTTDAVWAQLLSFTTAYLRQEKLDLAVLENLPLQSQQYATAHRVFSRLQLSSGHGSAEHWLLRLPKTFDEFMAARSKKRRYWLNRLPRVLDKEFPGEWSMVCYRSVAEAKDFAAAAETVACKTYHRGLGVGFQANQETICRLTMEAGRNQLCSYVLFIMKEPKAFWHCFKYGNRLYLASTGYDPGYGAYEVGTVLLLKLFQDYCGSEIEVVDFGLGDAEYKQRYGSEHFTETTLLLFPRTFKGMALNVVQSTVDTGNRLARKTLDSLRLTHRLKKIWRREKSAAAPAPEPSETGAAKPRQAEKTVAND